MHMETPRLIIRNFVHEDGGDLQEILGDSETMQYCEPAYDLPQTQKFLDSFCIASQGGVAVVCKETNKVIGYILFKETHKGVYEMGWFFNRNTWGRGYALESCKAVIAYAFETLNAHKIFAETILYTRWYKRFWAAPRSWKICTGAGCPILPGSMKNWKPCSGGLTSA